MKKAILGLLVIIMASQMSFAQPVSDMGIIPVGVTLNSILRLNIVSGGNIEFVVNNIDQYRNGVPNSTLYDTRFTIASSVDYTVNLYAESDFMYGTENPLNFIDVNNIGYSVEDVSGNDGVNYNVVATVAGLTSTATPIVTPIANMSAGDATDNEFIIHWELGTLQPTMNPLSLLSQSIPPDRYVVNALLKVE